MSDTFAGNGHHSVAKVDRSLYIFLAVLSLSLLGNVFQAWQIRALLYSRISPATQVEAKIGQSVPALQVATLEGQSVFLPQSSSVTTVVYIFSPSCHWCSRNRANIRSLAAQSGPKFQFVGLARPSAELKAYLAQNPLPFPIFVDRTGSAEEAMGFTGTPQTVVVSPAGKIIHNWVGVYDEATGSAVQSFFGVHLPGLLPS